jgi:hypothetical protein
MVTTRARAAILLSSIVIVVAGTAGCSAMQASGRWTRESGESMETYSKENEGVWGSVVGFFGSTNKAVGGAIESMAAGDSAATDASAGSGTTAAAVPVSMNPAPVAAVEPARSAQAAAPATDASITARAQTRLQELGYSVGKADGVLGPRTRAALLKYQRSKGLTESGKLDAATLHALGLA